ncbi:zinc fingers and homeoboxes 2-like protein [Labeo rohita]|uniref:Zinc fingers and homeoboxes 2-like protein n=1 Tax=Labeo rohita TaxID=84645 RepID=A0A498M3Z5_LABRO|nr:zinc fingers and homeoboxes protein 2 [Labeo rohita]XP_050993605.1 zinc fingers and homeoboxes protein 2 [Labeo rohita]XP_050993606.1 zinc fingers and homeoboxes protein 2 [Labeo rohita]XP_050993607.1 zinc fingers and homeoboxes protein 2 [Labeo rohita]XP_050993608.1 zinc fingers and homeoboxes protein 2 [Labeo rohita]RXN15579.1 zinc fingers and homeoboxes 2-like protein [Labeo rohita]
MSSRRKSSNPCVLRAASSTAGDSVEMDVSAETVLDTDSPVPLTTDKNWTSLNDKEEEQSEGGSASEQGLNHRDHEAIPQSEGPVSTLYLCTICNFSTNKFDSLSCHNKVQHPGESRFEVRHSKLDTQSILEQTIDSKNDGSLQEAEDTVYDLGPFVDTSNPAGADTGKTPMENSSVLDKGLDVEKLDSPILKDEIRAVSVNGTIIIPEPTCHVTPLLQRPPNLSTSPTIAVPLHTTKYNPILDSNVTLITSFNKFPYPTHAELSWLTAASKHPEEQIKVWFTTQRLKQGITWSPEEVEEARKKMFNGSVPPAHQTCEVLPASALNPGQAHAASFYGFGQARLASNITADRSPTTCMPGIATAVRQAQTLKRPLGTPLLASEVKRPTGDSKESLCMPPPPAPPPERLTITSPVLSETSPGSLVASDMKRPVPAHFVPPKGKLPMVQSKEKISVALPSVMPKERLPLSPIVSTNLKRSVIDQQMSNHISASSFVAVNKLDNGVTMPVAPAVVTPQEGRPTIIQTPSAVPPSLSQTPVLQCKPIEPSVAPVFPCFNSQNGKVIPHRDSKHWIFDQATNSQNDSQSSRVEFALRDRSVPTQFPLLERVKDKSPGQMKLLEESFQKNSFPSYNEVEHLAINTRLSREEIESWFMERRALRDDLEQALLNSMGSKRESQQTLLSGAQRRSGTLTFSPVPQVSKSMNLLKNVFVQNRWPSPVEFRHLEMQARFARTELVRWFRDSRLAQQSHVLDRKESFGERNSCRPADATKRPLREENTKPSSPEIENWFGNALDQHTGSNGEAIGEVREDRGGNACELLSDAD